MKKWLGYNSILPLPYQVDLLILPTLCYIGAVVTTLNYAFLMISYELRDICIQSITLQFKNSLNNSHQDRGSRYCILCIKSELVVKNKSIFKFYR